MGAFLCFFAFQSTFVAQIAQLIIKSWTSSINEHFIFHWHRGPFFTFLCFGQRLSFRSLGRSSEVEHNPKPSIPFLDDLGVFLHFSQLLLLWSLGQSSEVECNPKTSILFFNDIGGLFSFCCFLVDVHCWNHLADHQKLNIIQKWAFYFLMT